jgi:aerobic carbon-monoxide dehydrogenase small subunit
MRTRQQFLISVVVNSESHEVSVPSARLLSDFLRIDLGLTGTHVGCGTGECGACTVLVDGAPIRSCLSLAVRADGRSIETIESFGEEGMLHPVQQAFHEHHALQCGFCTPGFVTAAVALLRKNSEPSDEDIFTLLQGHLCRCTGYSNIVEALRSLGQRS